jgi:hypothetical protein
MRAAAAPLPPLPPPPPPTIASESVVVENVQPSPPAQLVRDNGVALALEYRRSVARVAEEYTSIARAPGGAPDLAPPRYKNEEARAALVAEALRLAALRTCTSSECGGPHLCVHRHAPPVSRDAAWHWRHFVAPSPLVDADVDAAQTAVAAMLRAHVAPSAWPALGADAERLAVLGFTLDSLVREAEYPLEDVIAGLNLDWQRLQTLGFRPAMLADAAHYPVVALVRAGLSAARLRAWPGIEYSQLAAWCSHEELAHLGFDAPALTALGMNGEDVLVALGHEHVRPRGVGWWVATMRFTPALLDELFPAAVVRFLPPADRRTYTELAVETRAAALT